MKAKAPQLVGGPQALPIPPSEDALGYLIRTGNADMFIAYCSSSKQAAAGSSPMTVVELPPALRQRADYGLVVLKPETPDAMQFVLFILSEPGQAILAKWGFETNAVRNGR